MGRALFAACLVFASASALSAETIRFTPVGERSPFAGAVSGVGPSVLPKPEDGMFILEAVGGQSGGFGLFSLPDPGDQGTQGGTVSPVTPVPAPPAVLLLLSGLAAFLFPRFWRARR